MSKTPTLTKACERMTCLLESRFYFAKAALSTPRISEGEQSSLSADAPADPIFLADRKNQQSLRGLSYPKPVAAMTARINSWVVAVPPTSRVVCLPSRYTLSSAPRIRREASTSFK
jgi:hypothetical protein